MTSIVDNPPPDGGQQTLLIAEAGASLRISRPLVNDFIHSGKLATITCLHHQGGPAAADLPIRRHHLGEAR